MDEKKIKEIAGLLTGLKRSEWFAIRISVEKEFDSEAVKIKLSDSERIERRIKQEMP